LGDKDYYVMQRSRYIGHLNTVYVFYVYLINALAIIFKKVFVDKKSLNSVF